MNLETVLMCAKMAAAKQLAGLGHIDPEIQALIDELTPAPVEEAVESVEVATPVVEPEALVETPQEAPAEEAQAEVAPAAEE